MLHEADRTSHTIRLRVPLALTVLCAAAATPAAAEVITVKEMLGGITITKEQCAALPQAVWIKSYGRDFCVRYYLSTAGGQGRKPLVFLQGDKFGVLDGKTQTFKDVSPDTKDVDTANLVKVADGLSKQAKAPGIYLSRIGVDGTSGHHRARKTMLELAMVDKALDAIKQRHGFEGFHLVGQSGGSTLVGGLIGWRQDIGCAVPGAGRLARLTTAKKMSDPGRQYFDPSDSIPAIIRNGARILVVTDPADEKVNVEHQVAFVRKLRKAGGQVEQFFAQATDKDHHFVSAYARYVAAACMGGKSNQEIAQGLAELVKKRLADATKARLQSEPTHSLLQSEDVWALPLDDWSNLTDVNRRR